MKKDKDKKIDLYEKENSNLNVEALPNSAFDMVNRYGTYEIQATADSHNLYPAIAQGFNKKIIDRDRQNTSVKDRIENP